jgi:hypothetical protein
MSNVIFRGDQLPELVSAVILKRKANFTTTDVKETRKLPATMDSSTKNVVLFGSYYDPKAIVNFAQEFKLDEVLIHLFESDMKAKAESLNENPSDVVFYEPVDENKESFIGYTWNRYVKKEDSIDHSSDVLNYLDEKARAVYKNPNTRAFIEWLYVKGVSFALIDELLFSQVHDIGKAIEIGNRYAEKSDSLVGVYANAAGLYQFQLLGQKYHVKIVDSTFMIELIGLKLAESCDIAIVSRFDHKFKQYRYTAFTAHDFNLVQLFSQLGYSNGGWKRCTGFSTNQSVSEMIQKFHVV